MEISQNGINLLKELEGCCLYAYDDFDKWIPHKPTDENSIIKGTLTIGIGHTHNVKKGQTITQEQAIELLKEDLKSFEKAVNENVKVEINQNQYDSLVIFAFNVGVKNFTNSTLLKFVNVKNFPLASRQFDRWNKSKGKVMKGLVIRRQKEKALFLKPM